MNITNELRKWARGFENVWFKPASKEIVVTTGTSMPVDHVNMCLFIEGMSDRIDAEYQKAKDEWKAKDGQTWLRGYMECHAELMEGDEVIAADLEEAGWVRGPVDADGEMWHSGDMSDSNWGVIEGIAYEDGRWLVSGHDISAPWIPADSIRHYHLRHYRPPTVEDVLREFNERMDELGTTDQCVGIDRADAVDAMLRERAELVAEYAKLRLAGEDE